LPLAGLLISALPAASSQLIHAVGELQWRFTLQDGTDIGGDKADACTWKLIVRNFHSQLVDEPTLRQRLRSSSSAL
jgi:hypothetical protein